MRTILELDSGDPEILARCWTAIFGRKEKAVELLFGFVDAMRQNKDVTQLADSLASVQGIRYMSVSGQDAFEQEGAVFYLTPLKGSAQKWQISVAVFPSSQKKERRLQQLHRALNHKRIDHSFRPFTGFPA